MKNKLIKKLDRILVHEKFGLEKNYTIACAFKHYLFLSYYQISEYFLDFYENIHSENSDLKNFGA
mgnify:CR=1 FL=1